MATTDSLEHPKSRLTQGGDAEALHRRIGWWERRIITKSELDIEYTITRTTARRPDLIAYEMYGDPTLQWLVLQYNNIIDINEELIERATLTLPTKDRLGAILNKPLGGVTP